MQSKLTLRMDEELIEQAKRYAKEQGKSLSQVVAGCRRLSQVVAGCRRLSQVVAGCRRLLCSLYPSARKTSACTGHKVTVGYYERQPC